MDKVKLPKYAAEALEDMKAKGATLNEIVERHVHKDHIRTNGYGIIEQLSTDTLIRALYIGYEVEQTPEEQAIQWMINRKCIARGFSEHDIVMAIKSILNQGVV